MNERERRRGVWGWMLYDWASQPFHTVLITFVFAAYFADRVVGDPVEGQAMWGFMMGAAGLAIALMAPVLGAIADASGPRKPWIAAFSVLYVAGSATLWFAVPGMEAPWIILVAFAIGLVGAEFTAIFTNAMLPDLGPREEVGRISGSGWAMGYLGGLVSLVVILLLMVGDVETGKTLIGLTPILGLDPSMGEGERATGIYTAIWFVIFVIPLFIWTPDVKRKPAEGAVRRGMSQLRASVAELPRRPSFATYLVSSMFYRDALNGLYAFGGIYAVGVLDWSIIQLGVFGILANITGALGAWLGGYADKALGPKPVITFSIWTLTIVCLIIVTTEPGMVLLMPIAAESGLPTIVFYICGAVIGAAGGSIQAASRTLLVHQAPQAEIAQSFGLYALTGKATAWLAPTLIGWMTLATDSQRLGVTPLIVLFLIGLVTLVFVRKEGDVPHVSPA